MTSQAVAISTTGHEHRLGFLETSVRQWDEALSPGDSLFVTVDGSERDCANVAEVVKHWTGSVFRVGRPAYSGDMDNNHRLGVAVNKNTGLELMMDRTRADHLFLSDDDCGPRSSLALDKHTDLSRKYSIGHSMVCWGAHRLLPTASEGTPYARWSWPRGVMLYTHRTVVDIVGGMVEAFGAGGHEHAEWSRRIHQSGFTPAPYISPKVYEMYSIAGQAQRAERFWECQDMRKIGETSVNLGHRRKAISTLPQEARDYGNATAVMREMDGSTAFMPFRSHENGRASASLCSTSTGLGAGGDL
jgi:hypothetical protein